jgi:hypothetical protein
MAKEILVSRVPAIYDRESSTQRATPSSQWGLSQGLNIKWLAEYCGTSVAMIEKHYGRYIKNDSREQLERLFGAKTETFTETL